MNWRFCQHLGLVVKPPITERLFIKCNIVANIFMLRFALYCYLTYICVTKADSMTHFNKDFYQPNMNYTVEMAEKRLTSLGYKNFSFTGSSFSNGASFYFTSEDGKKIRVSDHCLTGKIAFDIVEIDIVEKKMMGINRK